MGLVSSVLSMLFQPLRQLRALECSLEKTCSVCLEKVKEKPWRQQKFGILPSCSHIFCLGCIRKWRRTKLFIDVELMKACPECRVPSDFVYPSCFWIDDKEEKERVLTDYKRSLATRDCKYFNGGYDECPFGDECLYLHAPKTGTLNCAAQPPYEVAVADFGQVFNGPEEARNEIRERLSHISYQVAMYSSSSFSLSSSSSSFGSSSSSTSSFSSLSSSPPM